MIENMLKNAEKTLVLGTREEASKSNNCRQITNDVKTILANTSRVEVRRSTLITGRVNHAIRECIVGAEPQAACREKTTQNLLELQKLAMFQSGFSIEDQEYLNNKFGANFALPSDEQYETERAIMLYGLWLRNQIDIEHRLATTTLPPFGLLPMRRSEFIMTNETAMPLFSHSNIYISDLPKKGAGRLVSLTALIYAVVQKIALDQSLGRNSAADPFCLSVVNLNDQSKEICQQRKFIPPSMPIPHHKYDFSEVTAFFNAVDNLLNPDLGKRLDARDVSLPTFIHAKDFFKNFLHSVNLSESIIGYTLISQHVGKKYTPNCDFVIRDRLQIQRIINSLIVLFNYQQTKSKS